MRNTKPLDLQAIGRKSVLAVELEHRREQIRQLTANQPEPESPSPEQDSDDEPDAQELADSHQARNGNRAQRRAAARRLARRYR